MTDGSVKYKFFIYLIFNNMCSSIYCDDCIFNVNDECKLNQLPVDYNWKYTDRSKNDHSMHFLYLFKQIRSLCCDSLCRTCKLNTLTGECSISAIPTKFMRNWTKLNGRI